MPDWFGKRKNGAKLHASRIEEYALIGDLETAALVSREGSIDWLCWPTFSSGAVFAALLGTAENGAWQICPKAPRSRWKEVRRRYLPDTTILETTFVTRDGEVTVTDLMPPRDKHSDVIRIVRGVSGKVAMRMDLTLRFDYGLTVPWVTRADGELRAVAGPNMAVLRSESNHRTHAEVHGEGCTTASEFTLRAGDQTCFVLTYAESTEAIPERVDVDQACRDTATFWREWIGRSAYRGEYTEQVKRSLMTLKALTYAPTAGIVAAPTLGLPEAIGGTRNWDYRYCWLRDTAFTLLVLMTAGYEDEAIGWRSWLLRAIAGSPDQVQSVYGLAGERRLEEWTAGWLPGYENSTPVRVGNKAAEQFQLDVYGEVAVALSHTPAVADDVRMPAEKLEANLIEHLCKIWPLPDEGIWETRGPRQHYVHSKVMAWVALDRAVKHHEKFDGAGDVKRWRKNRDMLHKEICKKGFNKKLNSFTQSYGSKALDSSLLRLVLVGFLPPDDPRLIGTVDAIEKNLSRDGLLIRYNSKQAPDGLAGGEGTFLACSFWLVISLHVIGRTEQAKVLFERLLSLCNDVGLLSEEYDPKAGRMLGNFPQALSHIALVHAAFTISGQWKPEPYHV